MTEIAEQIFDLPVRRGAPSGIGGLADQIGNPSLATAVGLVLRAQRQRGQESSPLPRGGMWWFTDVVGGILKKLF
jgi:cell division protein FtsA